MRQAATRALDTWPDALKKLPASDNAKKIILSRLSELALVREVRPTMLQGHSPGTASSAMPTG